MIDTHTHLYDFEEDGGKTAVENAMANGVEHFVFPNVDRETVGKMLNLANHFPEYTSVALGLHPTEVNADWHDELEDIFGHFSGSTPIVAIGEVGIDLHWDKTNVDVQMQAFEKQLCEAERRELPVIIHSREAFDQTLEVLSGFKNLKCVFHSFTGSANDVEQIRKQGDFFFGINGVVTFKNSGLVNSLPAIGLDRILLETDAPYLAPVPFRGKRNESAYLKYIAAKVAEGLNVTFEAVDETTTVSARKFFSTPTLKR